MRIRSFVAGLLALVLAAPISAQTIRAGNGTAAAPSFTWNNGLTSGLYLINNGASDTIGVATNGAIRWKFGAGNGYLIATANARLHNANGASGSPSYSFASDDDLGIYRFGADTLGIATGGSASLGVASGSRLIGLGGDLTLVSGVSAGASMIFQGRNASNAVTQLLAMSGNDSSAAFLGRIRTGSGTGIPLLQPTAGSASAPSYSFGNDLDLGLYRFGSDTLGVAAGGVGRLLVMGNGAGYSLRNAATGVNEDAGLLFNITGASSRIALKTAGAERMVISGSSDIQFNRAITHDNAGALSWTLGGASGAATFTGGAGNMTIQAGTGNSRSLILQGTNTSGTAITGATITNSGGTAMQLLVGAGLVGLPSLGVGASDAGIYFLENGSTDTLALASNGTSFLKGLRDTVIINNKAKITTNLTDASGTPGTLCYVTATFQITKNNATSCVVSAARFKLDIAPLDPAKATESVMAMRPSAWTYIDGGRKAVGLIADNVDSIDTRLGFRNADGQINSYDQAGVIGLLVATVQQQQRDLELVRAAIAARDTIPPKPTLSISSDARTVIRVNAARDTVWVAPGVTVVRDSTLSRR